MIELEQGIVAYESSDFNKAFELLMPLAKEGNCEAQSIIAGMYLAGNGIERNLTEARKWYQPLAEQGNPIAQNNLATLILNDEPEQALKWLASAAEQGFPFAQNMLGDIYSGEVIIPRQNTVDYIQALKWYEKAAAQGFHTACHRLGEIYASKLGVDKYNEQAVQWYKKAATQNYKPSQEVLAEAYDKGLLGLPRDPKLSQYWLNKAGCNNGNV